MCIARTCVIFYFKLVNVTITFVHLCLLESEISVLLVLEVGSVTRSGGNSGIQESPSDSGVPGEGGVVSSLGVPGEGGSCSVTGGTLLSLFAGVKSFD